MSASPSQTVLRSLRLSVVDGVLHAVMVGTCESYLGALAVELGHRDLSLALLVTVPILSGAASQLFSARLVALLGSRKRLVVTAATLQALSHLAFLAIALGGVRSFVALLLAKILFWCSGLVIAPSWNSWMGSLTAGIARARYFALRGAVVHIGLLAAFVGTGFALDRARASGATLTGFAVAYGVGLTARLGSATALAFKTDPAGKVEPGSTLSRVRDAIRHGRWRVALYVSAVMLGTHVAAPFFTPYMLRVLRLDYREFALLTAMSILAKVCAFPLWRRVVDAVGLRRTLLVAGLGVSLVMVPWTAFESFGGLMFAQAFGGAMWAGFELVTLQLLLDSAPERASVEFFSLSSTLTGVLQVCGSLLGSFLLTLPAFEYRTVFATSGILRALALLLLAGAMVGIDFRGSIRLFLRIVSVRPSAGAETGPILGAEKEDRR